MNIPVLPTDPLREGMPPFLFNMARLTAKGAALHTTSQSGLQAFTNAPDNTLFFQGFHFAATLPVELNKLQYGIDDPYADWHKGLGPGLAMSRDRMAVLAGKRKQAQIDTYGGMGLALGRLDDPKLDNPVPTPPVNYQDFLFFLTRYHKLMRFLLGQDSNWYHVVLEVYYEVMRINQNAALPDLWATTKGPFVIWALVLAAKTFFVQTRTRDTFYQQGCIILTDDPKQYARDLLRDATSIAAAELPPPLFRILTAGLSHPTSGHLLAAPTNGGSELYATTSPHIRTAPAPTSMAHRPHPTLARQKPKDTHMPARNHPNPPAPSLVQFFASLQSDQAIPNQNRRTNKVLQHAGLTIHGALELLGLNPDDCFNYHVRGSCSSKTCTNNHDIKPIPRASLTQLLTKLTPVVPQLKQK